MRRAALLALVLVSGCALCRVPPRSPDVPPSIEQTAFIDQREECWSIDVKPEALQFVAMVLRLTLAATGGE